jgi:uncharacterized sporulation protein YeaH/YhbH (DUF444 family)
MTNIIDRRLNPRDKTIRNRQKFIARSKDAIKKEIKKIIDKGSIKDIDTTKTKVRVKGVSEPTFTIDPRTGNKKFVLPGNKEYAAGDTVPKKQQESGESGNKAGEGKGEDDFEFLLTQDEFLDFLFDELELPNLIKKQLKDVNQVQYSRAGFKNYGTPNQLDVVRSMKNALGRRISMGMTTQDKIEELEKEIEEEKDSELRAQLEETLRALKERNLNVPWIDTFDIRYRNYVATPKPITQAVMFCIMDVSASMGEREKDIAKRFFMLLHVFLKRKYEKLDVVFVAHHTEAKEVDEHTFFHGRETGGTLVSSALCLTNDIIDERYNPADWNIYVAQCSDGDNITYDDPIDTEMPKLLTRSQYMAYVPILLVIRLIFGEPTKSSTRHISS